MKRCAAVVLLATTATASAEPPAATSEPAEPQLMPPGVVAPRAPAPPPAREQDAGWFAPFAVGTLTGFVGIWGGGYLGYHLECASGCGAWGGLGGLVVGAGLGLPIGATLGVAMVGGDRDHEASSGLTFLGSAIGSIGGWYIGASMLEESAFGASVVVSACTALGGTLMYRLSRTRKKPASALRVVPLTGNAVGLSVVGPMW